MFHNFFRLLWLLVLFISFNSHAQVTPLILKHEHNTRSVLPHAELLEDHTQQLELQDVLSKTFQTYPVNNERFNLGRTQDNIWIRFQLQNDSLKEWYLQFDEMLHGTFEIYFLDQYLNPLNTQHITPLKQFKYKTWALDLPQNESIWIYTKINNGKSMFNISATLASAKPFIKTQIEYYQFFVAIYAAILTLALYHFILGSLVRESGYISLAVMSLAVVFILHRLAPVFPWPNIIDSTTHHFAQSPLFAFIAASFFFARRILQTEIYLPRAHTFLSVAFYLSITLFFLIGFVPSAQLTQIIAAVSMLVLFISTLLISALAAWKNSRIAQIYFGICLLTSIIRLPLLISFSVNNGQWSDFELILFNFSSLTFVLLLAVLQAHQVRSIQDSAQRAKLANEAKDTFLASMSHELRTPMHTILGFSHLLKSTSLSMEQQQHLSHLENASHHMQSLINNVLDTAAIKNQKLILAHEPFKLDIILTTLHSLFEQEAKNKGVELVFKVNKPETAIVGDHVRLLQVLINLISNALKHTQQGKVTLTIRVVTLDQKNVNICFFVKDTGSGIPKHKLAYLFEPFTQLDTNNPPQHSLGLGLTISHEIVKAMGGELTASSQVNQGSLFRFSLNFIKQALSTNKPQEFEHDTQILLVDDCKINLALGKQILTNMGAQVEGANSAKAAIALLHKKTFDIALIDLNMPEMDGFELNRWIKQFKRTQNMPVLALSAHTKQSILTRYQQAHFNDFLPKPFEPKQLFQAIKQHVSAVS